jgi:transcriptional regulator GlxA family with amidase domain
VTEHRIVIVTYPQGQSLDIVGPADVFDAATRLGAPLRYRIEVVSVEGGPLTLSNGITMHTAQMAKRRGPIDTLLVAGGRGPGLVDPRLSSAVARLASRSKRVASVCTGAFVLAEAGLLDRCRATTHWASSGLLQSRYPNVVVEADRIWIRDHDVWTSAGVTAGIDLALALVTDDCGPDLSREIARWLVIYLQRPGGQSQFSDHLAAPVPKRPELTVLLDWMRNNLTADLSVAALSAHASMSARQLLRRFHDDLDSTPAAVVLDLRLSAAKTMIETTSLDMATIARRSGFSNLETLHRNFKRRFGTSPGRHRELFSAAASTPSPAPASPPVAKPLG